MISFLSFFLLFSSLEAPAACTFKSSFKKIISLSGPVTAALNELGLIHHPSLAGISVFSPVSRKKVNTKIYPGGIYLSQTSLQEFSGALLFYDESQSLKSILQRGERVILEEIKTRQLAPLEVVALVKKKISPYLEGCDQQIATLLLRARSVQDELLKKIPSGLEVIFYLGEFQPNRPPQMVMVNDGVVKLLMDKNKIKTYPTALAYIPWSSKILNSFGAKTLHVGIKDAGMEEIQEVKRMPSNSQQINLLYPGALTPGLTQLEAFLFLVNTLF